MIHSARLDRLADFKTELARAWQVVVPLLALLSTACSINPYDPAEEPRVTVIQGMPVGSVTIEWQPAGAQLVRVYRGPVAGDGYGDNLMWSIAATTTNGLQSGAVYGASPAGGATDVAARPLVVGETYTAQVTRRDPRGSGEGFTNTSNRYIGTATFVLGAAAPF